MRFFIQENKETIKVAASIAIFVAGVVLVILRQPLIGIVTLCGGLLLFCYTLSRILHSGGYSGDGVATNGLGGQGRQQSEATKVNNPGAVSETDSGIWEQMTEEKP